MSMGAMLQMMQRMMGQQPGDQPGQKPGEQAGDQAGEGQTGDSDTANQGVNGDNEGAKEERRLSKSSGRAGTELPQEFRKALDAYNKNR